MVDSGMTHKEIAEAISIATGQRVQRSTVSASISRAGLSAPAKKYPLELPWRVKDKHQTHYAARMLRILGRRHAGIQNSLEMDQRLDSWLATLKDAHAVVVYLPNTPEGFYNVDGDWPESGIPIMEKFQF